MSSNYLLNAEVVTKNDLVLELYGSSTLEETATQIGTTRGNIYDEHSYEKVVAHNPLSLAFMTCLVSTLYDLSK